jgi:large subunit ribosomal protein L31
MKKGIHPEYYKDAKIICACGAIFQIGATEKEMHIEICSQCHPFYTGKKKVIDTMGRVDRFMKLTEKSASKKQAIKKERAKKKEVKEKPAKKKKK